MRSCLSGLGLFILLTSCSLHSPIGSKGNPPTPPTQDTTGIIEGLSIPENKIKSETGIITLENGGQSLLSRLWLFDHAQKTIDIQYYSFAKDITGLIVAERVLLAADRGVKIRILIDDAASKMYSHGVQVLDSHDNIEVRIYNAGLMLGRPDRRIMMLFKNYNRILRRMHNKTVTIDGKASIMGGRNVANRYFDYDHYYNFRDRDVLLIGKTVKQITQSFDEFWNDSLTVVYTEISGAPHKKWYNDASRFDRIHKKAANTKKFSQHMREQVKEFPAYIKAATKTGAFIWTDHIVFISDKPGKNEDRKDRKGSACSDSLMNLIRLAKESVDIQSPYFILTEESKEVLTEAIQRGVRIRLLTNSLGSTDNFEAFSGYQKDREEVLKMGITIHEFKPDAKERFKLMIPEVQSKLNYKPTYGFHSKTLVIDKRITIIGSYNFDPRSANYNSECITVIRSKEMAEQLLEFVEEEFLPENSWSVSLDHNPDSKASIIKRIKVTIKKVIPKKLL
jgi:phosphatidylserine/phosphatidylglycerophosphate/cardiolipin synthase-like enzyme